MPYRVSHPDARELGKGWLTSRALFVVVGLREQRLVLVGELLRVWEEAEAEGEAWPPR